MKRLMIYLTRWQLSTPVLAFITWLMVEEFGSLLSAVAANLIGGLMFYKIDKKIFKNK